MDYVLGAFMTNIDPYEVLGVKKEADLPEIRKAYKELAMKLHPDKIGSNTRALEQMKLVNEAYAILSNKKVRIIVDDDEDWKEMSTSEDRDKVWEEYSKQVEEYYRQVQKYLEEQMAVILKERERFAGMELDMRRREELLKRREQELAKQNEEVRRARSQEARLKEREEFLAKRENELDELMVLISKANALVVNVSQSSKALRNRQ